MNMRIKSVAAMVALVLGVALGVIGIPRANAAAMNPCGYSVNYYCGVTTSSQLRTKDMTVTATGNYARETSTLSPQKIVGYLPNGLTPFYTTVQGTADTIYQTFSKRTVPIYWPFYLRPTSPLPATTQQPRR